MPQIKGKTRQCSKCKNDLGKNYGRWRYCAKCRAEYARQHRRSRADVKYNEAIEDVLKLFGLKKEELMKKPKMSKEVIEGLQTAVQKLMKQPNATSTHSKGLMSSMI